MRVGMIGLGKMGGLMAQRLMRAGHEVVAYDISKTNVDNLVSKGALGAYSIEEFCAQLQSPRVAWLMLPAGTPTQQAIEALSTSFSPGDMVIDGGNSFYQDDIRHAKTLAAHQIHFMDCGTSGGVWGLERGYCLMIGGDKAAVAHCDPIFKALAPGLGNIERTAGREKKPASTAEEGYLHCGPVGSGHFVKMVHNGIEYGLMQAYAEGFDILRGANQESIPQERRYEINLEDVAEVWRRGSVVGSWLLDLAAEALLESPQLEEYSGYVEDTGEGRWTVDTAIEQATPANVLTASLFARFRSRRERLFSDKMLSAMRMKFGGHTEKRKG